MNTIDLGNDVEFEVKYAGAVYALREPSAREMNEYQKALKADEKNERGIELLIDFVSRLGLPKDVAEKMPGSKLNRLVSGLVEGMAKKN